VARAEKSRKRKRAANNKYKSKSQKNTGQCKRVMDLISAFCGNKQELCQAKYDTEGETNKIKYLDKNQRFNQDGRSRRINFTKSKAFALL